MLKHYIKIAGRNLWRNKGFSAITIFGLAIGLATCLLITLFIVDELSYDKYNVNADQIYRVDAHIRVNGSSFNSRVTPASLGPALPRDYPAIENMVRIRGGGGKVLVTKGNQTLMEPDCFWADSTLFDVFTLPMISGNLKTALTQPHSIVLSRQMALKYFNSTDVVGKTLLLDNTTTVKITGVIEDMPAESHLHFHFIRSMSGLAESRSDFWLNNNFGTYVLARPGTDEKTIDHYLQQAALKYAQPQLEKTLRYDVDTRYIATMGMKLASGRNFSKDFGTDSTAIIVNQTDATAFGWGKDALGHTITRRDNDGTLTTYRVIGVVKDFHFRSLHELISPLVMVLGHGAGTMILKVKAGNTRALLTDIRKKWDALTPEASLSYSFLDDRVSHTYVSEQQTGRILGIFSGLAIFIACLGLFGLVMYAARRRTREIGIRKVLGAGVPGIVGLLTKDFIRLVVMAFIMAAPVAWWTMHTWLQDFAYRIRISWWIFLLAGVVAMVIALATVGLQAVKAAMANPVKSLRTE
jgi:hypothetical protein